MVSFRRKCPLLVAPATLLIILLLFTANTSQAAKNKHSCDKIKEDDKTCIVDRSLVGPIKVIVHGTKNDPFWQQVYAGMKQTADDMKVGLDMILYDDNDPDLDEETLPLKMVEDIKQYSIYADDRRRLGSSEDSDEESLPAKPAAMIVSLPGDSRIENELQKFQDSDIPIFGINAVDRDSNHNYLKGIVAMDEIQAGIMAGNQIKDLLASRDAKSKDGITGVFVNHRSDVNALQERYDALVDTTEDVVDSWKMVNLLKSTTEEEFFSFFEGCKDTVIQLAGGSGIADAVLSALVANGCNVEKDHIVGTFDTSTPLIYEAISEGTIDFAVSQQPYLQGSNAVLMAVLYATTGQKLGGITITGGSPSSIVQTGPVLITPENENLPSKEQQVCEAERFPVCSDDEEDRGKDQSACPCKDRSDISIAVLTHDESSGFWDPVFSGISQAAIDFGVTIQKNRFKGVTPNKNKRKQHGETKISRLKHTFDINEACQSQTTDGLIVSLPDASMVESLAGCASRGIPYLAVNAIAGMEDKKDKSKSKSEDEDEDEQELVNRPFFGGMQYVGQRESQSGLEAGKRLIDAGVQKGWCLVHENFDTILERCRGMEKAFSDAKAEYMGIINVPSNRDEISLYKKTVEATIGDASVSEDDWDGVGVLSTGLTQIPALLSLVEDHPEMLAGTFDLDSTLYRLDDNTLPDQIIFGIDQNAYMEGYLSVATMVWKITTSEASITTVLETGPNFIVQSTPVAVKQCQNKKIKFCGESTIESFSFDDKEDEESSGEKLDYEPQPLSLTSTGKCGSSGRKCNVCEGDCQDDTDCAEGLVCFIRDSKTKSQQEWVPGCSDNPIEYTSKDFCVDARLYQCKDVDSIEVKVGTFSLTRNCAYVAEDMSRCTEFGRFCRETCGYCRSTPHNGVETGY